VAPPEAFILTYIMSGTYHVLSRCYGLIINYFSVSRIDLGLPGSAVLRLNCSMVRAKKLRTERVWRGFGPSWSEKAGTWCCLHPNMCIIYFQKQCLERMFYIIVVPSYVMSGKIYIYTQMKRKNKHDSCLKAFLLCLNTFTHLTTYLSVQLISHLFVQSFTSRTSPSSAAETFSFYFKGLGFEFRALVLQSRHSTT
jgi:hypothetical protein